MGFIFGLIVGFVAGVVSGFLFFRANPDKKAVVDSTVNKL
jgi:hypothetical protein